MWACSIQLSSSHTTHLLLSRRLIPVSNASVAEMTEMAWSEYGKGFPPTRLKGVGVHFPCTIGWSTLLMAAESSEPELRHRLWL